MYAIAFGPRQSLRLKAADTYKRKAPPSILLVDGGALRE